MNMNVNRFSRLGFCCVLTPDARIGWCDDDRIFKKILVSKSFKEAFAESSKEMLSFKHKVTVDGVQFMVIAVPVPEKRYVCTAYPEIVYMKHSYSEMYARIFNVRRTTGRELSVLEKLEEKMKADALDESYFDLLKEMYDLTEETVSDSDGICRLFDAEHLSGYIDLEHSLRSTFATVKKYNSLMRRDITADISLDRCVARVNYTVMETMLIETVRILYKTVPENGCAVIRVKGKADGSVSISTEVPEGSQTDPAVIDGEIRDIRCAAECLGGSVKISPPDEGFSMKAVLPISLSNYTNRLRNDIDEIPGADLRGYHRLFAPQIESTGNMIEFRDEHIKPAACITFILADILLGELASGYSA